MSTKESASDEIQNRIKAEVTNQMKPKEDMYSAESFLKHQEMCSDTSCPVCHVMNDKLKNLKVSNTLEKVGDTLHNLNEKRENERKKREEDTD